MARYHTQAEVEQRISHEGLREITDDNVDGEIDTDVIERFMNDSESTVESYLRKVYDLALIRSTADADILNSTTNLPNEIKRLCLDITVGKLFDRFPEYIRAKGADMVKAAKDELREFARGLRRLDDIATIENTIQVKVEVRSGDPLDTAPADKFFVNPDSFGIY